MVAPVNRQRIRKQKLKLVMGRPKIGNPFLLAKQLKLLRQIGGKINKKCRIRRKGNYKKLK